MSSLSPTQSRSTAKPRIVATPGVAATEQVETIAVAGAQLLAEAVTSFAVHDASKGRVRGKNAVSFFQAYSTIGQAVPKNTRVQFLREMMKALEQAIKVEEHEGKPATPRATGKAQQANDDFMAEMRMQEQTRRAKDIASKKLLRSGEMAGRLGVTKQALTAAVRAQRMFVLSGPSGENYFPAFFAEEKYDRRVLEKVSKTLGGVSGGSKWEFFTNPRVSLMGKSPLEAISKGNIEPVMELAAAFRDE